MNNLNSILLEGNLVDDPTYSENYGALTCGFKIASQRYFKELDDYQNEVSFFQIYFHGKLVESFREHLKKGSGVRVCGRLKQIRTINDDGKQSSKIVVVAASIELKPVIGEVFNEN